MQIYHKIVFRARMIKHLQWSSNFRWNCMCQGWWCLLRNTFRLNMLKQSLSRGIHSQCTRHDLRLVCAWFNRIFKTYHCITCDGICATHNQPNGEHRYIGPIEVSRIHSLSTSENMQVFALSELHIASRKITTPLQTIGMQSLFMILWHKMYECP